MTTTVRFEEVSKQYRLGEIGTGTLSQDIGRAWAKLLGKEDPYAKVGEENKREVAGGEFVWALKDVSADIRTGEVVGIIGRNGAGKSTLLKLLSRVTAPTRGCIKARGRIASLLEVGTGFHPELSGRENVFLNGAILGMSKKEIARKLDAIVEFSGCAKYIDTPVKRYSSGMTVRLGFAVAAHLDCEILIVDEVLAVGDMEFQKRCLGRMRDIATSGRTVLFVSHNLGSITQLCTRCLLLEYGRLAMDGDTGDCIRQYLSVENSAQVTLKRGSPSRFNFRQVTIKNSSGEMCSSVRSDESMGIEIAYENEVNDLSVEIGIRVDSDQGIIVFTSERSNSVDRKLPTGSNIAFVEIPGNFLTPGDYRVTVASYITNQEMLKIHEHIIGFRIEECGSQFAKYAGTRYGLVFCSCRWNDGRAEP